MASSNQKDQVVGIILVVLGALFLLGIIDIPFFDILLGVLALVAGILVLLGKLRGPTWLGVVLIVAGVLILGTPYLNFITGTIAALLNLIIGVVLLILGILKLMGK